MRTARLLPISPSMDFAGVGGCLVLGGVGVHGLGVCAPGGVPLGPGWGVTGPRGVSAPGGACLFSGEGGACLWS